MTDILDRRPGGGGASGSNVLYKDEGDGSYSESVASNLRIWDATSSSWVKATADHTSGALNVIQTSGKTLKTAVVNLAATGTVITAVSTKRLKVYAINLNVSANLTVNWRDGASTSLGGAQALIANGGYTMAIAPPYFLIGTTAGNSLDLVISGAGTAAGWVSYWDDDTT